MAKDEEKEPPHRITSFSVFKEKFHAVNLGYYYSYYYLLLLKLLLLIVEKDAEAKKAWRKMDAEEKEV